MNVKLAYGKTGYLIELSETYDIDIIEPRWVESVSELMDSIKKNEST
jgi:hypothetical protein